MTGGTTFQKQETNFKLLIINTFSAVICYFVVYGRISRLL